jgi:hypothetical protein
VFIWDGSERWGQPVLQELIRDMRYPVRCMRCQGVYDVATVEVTARYSDCSVWVSPCCKQTVDDRPKGWVARPDIEKLY